MSALQNIDFYGKGDPVLEAAFVSFVQYAVADKKNREAFMEETGMKVSPGGIDALIDEATDYSDAAAETFLNWVAENLWGRED